MCLKFRLLSKTAKQEKCRKMSFPSHAWCWIRIGFHYSCLSFVISSCSFSHIFFVANINVSYVSILFIRFSCNDWVDEDSSPLIYTILAKRYNKNEEVDEFLIYKGTSSTFEVVYGLWILFRSGGFLIIMTFIVYYVICNFLLTYNHYVMDYVRYLIT